MLSVEELTTTSNRSSVVFWSPPGQPNRPTGSGLTASSIPTIGRTQINRLVDLELNLRPLFQSYSGRGSAPHRPDLLIKMLLYEHDRGVTQPTKWHRDLCENEPLQWLLMGSVPSLTSLYEFRDRLDRLLPQWNSAVIRQALTEGHTEAAEASLDGSTVAANASRHHLLNLEQLDRRIEQLKRADSPVAVAPEPAAGAASTPLARTQVPSDTTAAAELGAASAPVAPPTVDQATADAQPGWMGNTARGRAQQHQRYIAARQRLRQQHAENQRRRKTAQGRPQNPDQPHRRGGLPGKGQVRCLSPVV